MMPDAVTQPVPEPAVQFPELALQARHTKIVQPAPGDFFELLDTLVETHRSGFAGGLFYKRPKTGKRRWGPSTMSG